MHQRRLMEPGAPPVARRLAAMRILSEADVRTYALMGPVYPMATAHEVRELVRRVQGAGASYLIVDRLNLRRGVWASVSRALSADPDLLSVARARLLEGGDGRNPYSVLIEAVLDEAAALGLDATTV